MGIIRDPWYPERERSVLPASGLQALVDLDRPRSFQFGFGQAPVPEKPKKKRKKGKR